MANEIKYKDVNWGADTPINGERMATNSHYTGEHKGSVMQDALEPDANVPHMVEKNMVRYGTIMGDAIDPNFPAIDTGVEASEA